MSLPYDTAHYIISEKYIISFTPLFAGTSMPVDQPVVINMCVEKICGLGGKKKKQLGIHVLKPLHKEVTIWLLLCLKH